MIRTTNRKIWPKDKQQEPTNPTNLFLIPNLTSATPLTAWTTEPLCSGVMLNLAALSPGPHVVCTHGGNGFGCSGSFSLTILYSHTPPYTPSLVWMKEEGMKEVNVCGFISQCCCRWNCFKKSRFLVKNQILTLELRFYPELTSTHQLGEMVGEVGVMVGGVGWVW